MDDLPLRRCILLDRDQLSFAPALANAGIKSLAVLELPNDITPGEDAKITCKRLIDEARTVTAGKALLCVAIPAGNFFYEPYGDMPFAQGVAHFHELAFLCKEQGADAVMIHRAKSMLQARAGVLGARAAGLPVLVALEPIGEGDTLLGGTDLLAAFAVLRLLGIAAFGYASSVAALQLPGLETVATHGGVPLFSITRNLTGALSAKETGALFADRAKGLSELGVSAVGIWGAGEQQLLEAGQRIAKVDEKTGDERGTLTADDLWAASETQVYYLDENVEQSEPVECRADMTDDILEAEHEVCDLLCIELTSPDEAYAISRNNGNMDQMPVCFLTHDEAALEAALFYYNGRAVIDSRSSLSGEVIDRLAGRFGAVVI